MAKITTRTLLLSASLLTVFVITANAQDVPDYYVVEQLKGGAEDWLRNQADTYGYHDTYNDEEFRGALLNENTADGKYSFLFEGITVSGNTLNANIWGDSSPIKGGLITARQGITVNNSSFVENHIVSNGYNDGFYDGILNAGRDAGSDYDVGVITVTGNSSFSGNTVIVNNDIKGSGGHVFGLVTSARNGNSASFDGTTFNGNRMTSDGRVQGGVLHVFNGPGDYFGAELTADNAFFRNNEAVAFGVARGAAVENFNATFNATNTIFENNSVETYGSVAAGGDSSVGYESFGGALYTEYDAENNLTNVTFTGNAAKNGYGGAVTIANRAVVNFTTTKDITYSGNYATNGSENMVKDDSRGGFLYMVSSTDVGDT
jgi:hypothetical protein